MTVSKEVNHNVYTGNGVTTSFEYTFSVLEKSDLVVMISDLDENQKTLILDTDYTVTGTGTYQGGKVVLSDPLEVGWRISIAHEMSVTQETLLSDEERYFGEVHKDVFDKLTILVQQAFSPFRLALHKLSWIANYYDAMSKYIRNLCDLVRSRDAATKNYVDRAATGNLNRKLRVPKSYIPQPPSAYQRANKSLGMDSNVNPVMVLPEPGSAADALNELAKPTGAWKIGNSNTIQDLLEFDVREGFIYETNGFYLIGDGGNGRYIISSSPGEDPEISFQCKNGMYAILQHIGVITLEQLGAKPVFNSISEPTDDSWQAFYSAYTLARRKGFSRGIKFVMTGQSYRVSKPLLITSCMNLTTSDESQTTYIYYDGGKITSLEIPDLPGVYAVQGDTPIKYQNIQAYCIFVHRMTGSSAVHLYYSSLNGVWCKPSSLLTRGYADYGIYAPYIAKCNISNSRFEHCSYGHYSRDMWSTMETGTVYIKGNSPITNGIGYWNEPSYTGTSKGGAGGTSNILSVVGTNGFRIGFKIASWMYSEINGSHIGGAGTSVAWEYHWCNGVTVNGFGMESVRNKVSDTGFMRFYNSSMCVTSVTAAADVQVAGRYLIQCSGISKVDMREISLQAMSNTGTALNLCSVDVDSSLNIGSIRNDDIITSVGIVNGKLDSDFMAISTVGISNTSTGTTNVVKFTKNVAKYRYRGTSIDIYIDLSWTGGPGNGEFNIFGLPKCAVTSCTVSSSSGAFSAPQSPLILQGKTRIVILNATNASSFPVPLTGSLIISGSYHC